MADLARRFSGNPLLTPRNVTPSRPEAQVFRSPPLHLSGTLAHADAGPIASIPTPRKRN
jgi:hypothetical protein